MTFRTDLGGRPRGLAVVSTTLDTSDSAADASRASSAASVVASGMTARPPSAIAVSSVDLGAEGVDLSLTDSASLTLRAVRRLTRLSRSDSGADFWAGGDGVLPAGATVLSASPFLEATRVL